MGFLNPIFILSILIALSVHEWAHAVAADRLGDSTARESGRLTFNPISHLDPIGTILFLTVGFGWGKPVPVDHRYFRHPKRDMAITAIAGPLSNLILAFLAFLGLRFTGAAFEPDSLFQLFSGFGGVFQNFLSQFLLSSVFVNLGLMAFNLLPIAPLDGSKALQMFIPYRYEEQYEDFMRFGPYFLLFLLVVERFMQFSILSSWIGGIMEGVLRIFVTIVPGI